ncbi:MAG: glycosyltransferase, partial [Acidobacteriota bacterium]
MRILYFVPYAPSLIRVRPYQLIRALARRGNALTVVAPWSSESEREELRQLAGPNITIRTRRLPRWRPLMNCLRSVQAHWPYQAAFSWDPGLLEQASSALREESFDVVHVEHLRGSLFGIHLAEMLRRIGGSSGQPPQVTPVIWDSVDCISHLLEQAVVRSSSTAGRWMARLDLNRTRHFEGWLTCQFDHVLVTASADREALLQLRNLIQGRLRRKHSEIWPDSTFSVLPNGVDLDYFSPDSTPRDPETLVFSGKMSYHANVTAAHFLLNEIMPKVWRSRPGVRVLIAGKNPPKSLRTLAADFNSKGIGANGSASSRQPRVEVTGEVPDLRPSLRRSTISVVPIVYGAGIQNKVLEAMACGTPVVASPVAVG